MTILSLFQRFIDRRSATFFLIVGAISALAYFGSFAILYSWLHWPTKIAVTIAYIISVLVHFMGNRTFTFKSHGNDLFQHITKYLVMVFINYLITLAIMHIIVQHLHWIPYLGIAISIAVTVGSGYLMAKFWVFKQHHKRAK